MATAGTPSYQTYTPRFGDDFIFEELTNRAK